MGQIFNEISIELDGETFTFTPSNKLLRSIDAGLAPSTLLGVAHVMNREQLPLYDIAYIVSRFVEAGGGSVDEDDVLQELHKDLVETGGEGVKSLVMKIGECLTPVTADQKKASPQKPKKAKKTASK